MRRRWLFVGIIMVLIVAAVIAAQNRSPQTATSTERTARVARGTIRAAVSASGSIAPVAKVELNFGTPGTVVEIPVSEGEAVKAGTVLARLDTDELALSVKQAEQALATQRLVYSQTVSPGVDDLAAARAAIASAAASLKQLQGNPDPLQLQIAKLQTDSANESRHQAELQWDQVKDAPVGGWKMDILKSQYAQAVLANQIAQLQFEVIKRGGNEAQVSAARMQLAQAQSSLSRLLGDDRSRALAAAQVQQTELALEQARLRLKNATITAPSDGTLAEINLSVGQQVGVGGLKPAFVLADLSSFHIDVGVDENSIGALVNEQPVLITIDALPDQTLTGRVDRIAPTATNIGGIVSYKVVIALDPAQATVRGGLSANVEIVTQTREGVLLVPNWTIRLDRATGKAYVNVRRGDGADTKIEEVEITTGLRNANESEVVSGVKEGDELVVTQKSGLSLGG